jgi:hypothetical protein
MYSELSKGKKDGKKSRSPWFLVLALTTQTKKANLIFGTPTNLGQIVNNSFREMVASHQTALCFSYTPVASGSLGYFDNRANRMKYNPSEIASSKQLNITAFN